MHDPVSINADRSKKSIEIIDSQAIFPEAVSQIDNLNTE